MPDRTLRDTTRRVIGMSDKYAAFRHHVSMYMGLSGLVGLWTANHTATSGNWYDWTKNNLELTVNGSPEQSHDGLKSYILFDGATDYYSRADEAALSITGTETRIYAGIRGLTAGTWFYSTDATAYQFLISKLSAAAGNYSYDLGFAGATAGDPVRFWISNDGTNSDNVVSSNTAAASRWHFAVGRFDDNQTGAELAVFLDGVKTTAATARNSIFDGNGAFEIGAGLAGLGLLTGRMSVAFLCAAAENDDMIGALFQQSRALYGI